MTIKGYKLSTIELLTWFGVCLVVYSLQ